MLFYALMKNIHLEVPQIKDSLQVLYNQFLRSQENEDANSWKITPTMGLAIKLIQNFSKQQYERLASCELLGKLSGMNKVRMAADNLDPGNVSYEVLSKKTDEIIMV